MESCHDESDNKISDNNNSQLQKSHICANCCRSFKSTNGLRNHVGNCNTPLKPVLEVKESRNRLLTIDPQDDGQKQSFSGPITPPQTMVDSSDWLTQLANIATGPQSPLLQTSSQKRNPAVAFSNLMHTYAKPPKSPEAPSTFSDSEFHSSVLTSLSKVEPESDNRVSSSSPFPTSPEDVESCHGSWSHTWPAAVWQCFMKGTLIQFISNQTSEWQSAEEIGRIEMLASKAVYQITDPSSANQSASRHYAPNGLMLERIEDIKPAEKIRLTFNPFEPEQKMLQARCPIDHPFFVKDKGWSSYNPLLTVEKYGIPCSELETGDICIPPSHPDAISFKESNVFENFKSFDLTPLDTSTVLALSSLARHRRDMESNQPRSAPPSPIKKIRKLDPNRGFKRPMNAFMLFAKKFRLEYTQMYPGRDNRAISVVLGDEWKKLNDEQRKVYAEEAKTLADEHKKHHPDCWKRKRHASSSV
ncbi:HMG box-containing protein 1-like [Antedon mediterranea]|uniref:HMG box-containing protein 1-like n=1 Tax=Antedon mediterranea TaxID=105859 RepID=UPI003AF51561